MRSGYAQITADCGFITDAVLVGFRKIGVSSNKEGIKRKSNTAVPELGHNLKVDPQRLGNKIAFMELSFGDRNSSRLFEGIWAVNEKRILR